jgi:hypothetical protein
VERFDGTIAKIDCVDFLVDSYYWQLHEKQTCAFEQCKMTRHGKMKMWRRHKQYEQTGRKCKTTQNQCSPLMTKKKLE